MYKKTVLAGGRQPSPQGWRHPPRRRDIWKKSLPQEVRQKNNISKRRSKGSSPSTQTLVAPWLLGCCATIKGSSYIKNEYIIFFITNQIQHIFLFNSFFKTSNICFPGEGGYVFDHFLGKRGVLLQKLTTRTELSFGAAWQNGVSLVLSFYPTTQQKSGNVFGCGVHSFVPSLIQPQVFNIF